MKKLNEPLPLFYILVAYVFVQFGWWAYHIYDLNREIFILKSEIILMREGMAGGTEHEENLLRSKLRHRTWMVAGEGAIFLLLLGAGAWYTLRSFKREVSLSRQQRNFLLSVSHELKSPLSSIKLNLQTLLRHRMEEKRAEQMLKMAVEDSDRLNDLVDNLLLAARLENNAEPLQCERIDLSELLKETVERTRMETVNPAKVHSQIEPGVAIFADKSAMASVLRNLIENALKYSPPAAPVSVELERSDPLVFIRVRDEGPGIPDREKPLVFRKFYRIGNEETRRTKGTGLGLFIAKHLTEKQGGKLQVRDNIPAGCLFEITLPS